MQGLEKKGIIFFSGEPGSRLEVAAAFLEPRSNSSRASSLPVGFGMGNQQNVLILGDWLL